MKKIEREINSKILELTNLIDQATDKKVYIRKVVIEKKYGEKDKNGHWEFCTEQLMLKPPKNADIET
jgi:hypothetical protein